MMFVFGPRRILFRLLLRPQFSRWVYNRTWGTGYLARLVYLMIERGPCQQEQPAVLCIRRNLFKLDIDQLRVRAKSLTWHTVQSSVIGCVPLAWLPPNGLHQTAYGTDSLERHPEAWATGENSPLPPLKRPTNAYLDGQP